MNVRYLITLTTEEREMLRGMVQAGKGRFRRLKRAQILLAAAGGSSDVDIVKNLSVGASTVYRTNAASWRRASKPRSARSRVQAPTASLRQKDEALLIATACASPPSGQARDSASADW